MFHFRHDGCREYDPASGQVLSWTWAAEPLPGQPLACPFAWVLVKLDGAAAVRLMDEARAKRSGSARHEAACPIVAQCTVGAEPYCHLDGSVQATSRLLERAGMSDLFAVKEVFA